MPTCVVAVQRRGVRRRAWLRWLLVVSCCLVSVAARGEGAGLTIHQDLAALFRWVQFHITNGRLVAGSPQFDRQTASTARGENQRQERISISLQAGVPSISYTLKSDEGVDPLDEATIEMQAGTDLTITRRWGPVSGPSQVEFRQAPGEPLKLVVQHGAVEATARAPTLWHLAVAEPKLTADYLFPLLRALRGDWDLPLATAQIEQALLRAAAARRVPDRRRWAELVEQLGAESFAEREEADRQLRQAGPAVLAYLRSLPATSLDAEQRFRVRQMIDAFSGGFHDDTPSSVAAWLVADPRVWLALLARADEEQRVLADQQLRSLLEGQSYEFDPQADEATRQAQWERLRARLE